MVTKTIKTNKILLRCLITLLEIQHVSQDFQYNQYKNKSDLYICQIMFAPYVTLQHHSRAITLHIFLQKNT